MDIYSEIVKTVYDILIKGSFISAILMMMVNIFYKRIAADISISCIKWILIVYSISLLPGFLMYFISPSSATTNSIFISRIRGVHKFAYWLMLIGQFCPLLLFFKKLNRKPYLIIIISIFVNMGWLVESFIIHFDHLGGNASSSYFLSSEETSIILKGIILGSSVMLLENLIFLRGQNAKKNEEQYP